MKIIYSDTTQALIDNLNNAIEGRISFITNEMSKKGFSSLAVRDRIQSDRILNSIRNELIRVHQVAIPVSYEFDKGEK